MIGITEKEAWTVVRKRLLSGQNKSLFDIVTTLVETMSVGYHIVRAMEERLMEHMSLPHRTCSGSEVRFLRALEDTYGIPSSLGVTPPDFRVLRFQLLLLERFINRPGGGR